ncbi:hypothetical protein BASA61_001202 [Batrachochytrium salamandrivorans]|nr:hypothetical protein BASA61_001202 [Batrachochytrium salamandrivorans]
MADFVVLRLVPNQDVSSGIFDPIERKMYERVSLKLGRQVKSPQEKVEATNIAAQAMSIATSVATGQSRISRTSSSPTPITSASLAAWRAALTPAPMIATNSNFSEQASLSPFDHARAFFLGPVNSQLKTGAYHSMTTAPTTAATSVLVNTDMRGAKPITPMPIGEEISPATATLPTPPQPDALSALPSKTVETVWFKSKVVSRIHAEIWLKDGQLYLKDIGSSSGTFLNKLRLSPANKVSRPYPVRAGDIIQLGVDYQGRTEDVYKAVEIKVQVELPTTSSTSKRHNASMRFRSALRTLLTATNPYSSTPVSASDKPTKKEPEPIQHSGGSVDCCICLSCIGPYQALFIAPCSHCYHYKCIRHMLRESLMFPCPVCRQVANLDASVSMESLFDFDKDGHLLEMNVENHGTNEDGNEPSHLGYDEPAEVNDPCLDDTIEVDAIEIDQPSEFPKCPGAPARHSINIGSLRVSRFGEETNPSDLSRGSNNARSSFSPTHQTQSLAHISISDAADYKST